MIELFRQNARWIALFTLIMAAFFFILGGFL